MYIKDNFPTKNQLLVCTHTRADARQSCGNMGRGEEIKIALQEKAKQAGLDKNGQLRVMSTSCMGLCSRGPNVVSQPSGQWFSQVELQDIDEILDQLETEKIKATK